MRIAVLGGTFNPPTLAHLNLLVSAVNAIHADLGVFLPCNDQCMTRKMSRTKYPNECYPDHIRVQMLHAMIDEINPSAQLAISDIDIRRTGRAYTFESLELLQQEYPDAEIYFIVGADKLSILPRWHRINEFLQKFKILVADRPTDHQQTAEQIIQSTPWLNARHNRLTVIDTANIDPQCSSTAVRNAFRSNDPAGQLMTAKAVWALMQHRR